MRNDNTQALQPGAVVQLHRLCQGVAVQEDRLQTQVGFLDFQRFASMSTNGSVQVRGEFNNPRHGNFPLKGYPNPRGLHGQDFPEKTT